MERIENPEEQPDIFFTLQIDGKEIQVRPNNSAAYLHPLALERFDHIYVQKAIDGKPVYGFRDKIENFDDVIEFMLNYDYDVIPQDEPSSLDLKVYYSTDEGRAELQKLIDEAEKRPYDEKRVLYLRYLLDNNLINFSSEGDIIL